jgi:diacylglycerol kinase (ATP)
MNSINKKLFIINPVAGRGRCSKLLPKLKNYLKNYAASTEIYVTEQKGGATEFLKGMNNNYHTIVAVGGDGTINEIINGICPDKDVCLAVLPCGSGNDFAKAIGMDRDYEKSLYSIFNNNCASLIDVGKISYIENNNENFITNRLFINSCGIGFDALVAYLIKNTNLLTGLPLYLSAVFKAIFTYRPIKINASVDTHMFQGVKLLISIGNGKTSGGGFILNPFAELDDNKLDACLINDFSKIKILKNLTKAISGKHYSIKGVDLYKFKTCKIDLEEPNFLHLDGEVLSSRLTKAEITLEESKLKVIKGIA